MTYEFELVMRLMGTASRGTDAAIPTEDVDWKRVFLLAKQQQILPLICHALKGNPPSGCPNVLSSVLTDCARKGSVIALLEEMNAAHISCYVVKGFAAGINYASPEYRISGDTDIVIDPADENRACTFLENHGFTVTPRWEHGHHAVATHPQMGIIEVHVQLYDELVEDVWFSGIDTHALMLEPKEQIKTPDGAYWTLGPTDHVIFMALHLVKHFILSGMSLRMMMDVALAITKHRESVDMERFWLTLHSLHYDTLINTILWALIRYCGFAPEDFPGIGKCDHDRIQLILDDLEKGGWLGKNAEEARKAGWYEYNRQLLLKKKGNMQYRLYMLNWKHCFRLSTLLPGKKRLSRNYPWVLKYPLLIPFAWIHRVLFRGFALLRGGAWTKAILCDNDKISDESKARIAMFRRLEML